MGIEAKMKTFIFILIAVTAYQAYAQTRPPQTRPPFYKPIYVEAPTLTPYIRGTPTASPRLEYYSSENEIIKPDYRDYSDDDENPTPSELAKALGRGFAILAAIVGSILGFVVLSCCVGIYCCCFRKPKKEVDRSARDILQNIEIPVSSINNFNNLPPSVIVYEVPAESPKIGTEVV